MSQTKTKSRQAEVEFGESAERGILKQWRQLSKYANGADHWIRWSKFSTFDFAGFSKRGIPIVYVEVKRRRSKWGDHGHDVMFPMVKHEFALTLAARANGLTLIGVTLYSCGTVVEVDLGDEPDESRYVTRFDRPGESVKHGFWKPPKIRVFLPQAPTSVSD